MSEKEKLQQIRERLHQELSGDYSYKNAFGDYYKEGARSVLIELLYDFFGECPKDEED